MPALLPVATAILIGYLLVHALRPLAGAGPRWLVALFELSLGTGLGVGITSSIFFVLVVSGVASPATILSLDAAVVATLGAMLCLRRSRAPSSGELELPTSAPAFRWNWALALALGAALAVELAAMSTVAQSNPHGQWDAWAIWNVRARFLAGPGEVWRNAISPLLEKTHPDYPLLLAGFVGRCWKVSGNYDTSVPIATALSFFLATLGLLVSSLALIRSLSAGLLAGLVLLSGLTYVNQPMAQYADVPLAFYYLAALSLAFLAWFSPERRKRVLLPLAGAAAALSAWTKNEGLLFLVVFCGCYALAEWRISGLKKAARHVLWLLLGALPGLILVGWLKLLLAPVADPVVRYSAHRVAGGLARWTRIRWVLRQVFRNAIAFGSGISHPLILLGVLAASLRFALPERDRGPALFGAGTLAVVLGGYCFVSLGSPTPFDRFYSQLWPAFLLVAFLALRTVESTMVVIAPKEDKSKTRGKTKKKGRSYRVSAPSRPV